MTICEARAELCIYSLAACLPDSRNPLSRRYTFVLYHALDVVPLLSPPKPSSHHPLALLSPSLLAGGVALSGTPAGLERSCRRVAFGVQGIAPYSARGAGKGQLEEGTRQHRRLCFYELDINFMNTAFVSVQNRATEGPMQPCPTLVNKATVSCAGEDCLAMYCIGISILLSE